MPSPSKSRDASRRYLLWRESTWHYYRGVPQDIRDMLIAARKKAPRFVKQSLNTSELVTATKRRDVANEAFERHWNDLRATGSAVDADEKFQAAKRLARAAGFACKPAGDIELSELILRIEALEQRETTPQEFDALLGLVQEPELLLSGMLDEYQKHVPDKLRNKTERERIKWRNPRSKAINNLRQLVENKAVSEIGKNDVLLLRTWWINRIDEDGLSANSANKDITYLSGMWGKLAELYGWEKQNPFLKMRLTEEQGKRASFAPGYVQDKLLAPGALKGLAPEYRDLVCVMADTGAGIKEVVGLEPDDICLGGEIPHIIIRPNKRRPTLKTRHRARTIPLVGAALSAMKHRPDGWPDHARKNDAVSAAVNKFLTENSLFPSPDHTLYSLRHCFQDRLTNAGVPDRIQADLMGHRFDRQKYGDGGTLETVRDWLLRIAFTAPAD